MMEWFVGIPVALGLTWLFTGGIRASRRLRKAVYHRNRIAQMQIDEMRKVLSLSRAENYKWVDAGREAMERLQGEAKK